MQPEVVSTVLVVLGMCDNGSREHVAALLEGVQGVRDVDVNLHRGLATIAHGPGCHVDDLVNAVARAGYGVAVRNGHSWGASTSTQSTGKAARGLPVSNGD